MRLTKKSRHRFGKYVRHVADGMGLRDWSVDLSYPDLVREQDRAQGHRWCAMCEPTPGRKAALIEFSTDWLQRANEYDIRETVVHELVHCHFGALVDTYRNDLTDQLSGPVFDVFERNLTRNLEYGVDGIAEEWARHAPMPPTLKFKA